MREAIDFAIAIIFSGSLIFGGGYSIKQIHDYVKKEAIEQISQGMSSSEAQANLLTGEKLDF